ncbi:MAG: hypothetical protein KI793_23335 [Rivularia sp. (in: Bacteria)]|nr:hypothetical protein [Rivularia sp. MS3]
MLSINMQFYLNKVVDESELIKFLSKTLDLRFETFNYPDSQAEAFVMINNYEIGFPMDITISYAKGVTPKIDYLSLAKLIAMHYKTLVATDLPEEHPDKMNPYCWCVVEPKGDLVEMVEDISDVKEKEGLLLNGNSKKSLSIEKV